MAASVLPLGALIGGDVKRREGQRRRAFEIARHQEAAGRQHRKRVLVGACGAQIVAKGPAKPPRDLLVLGVASGSMPESACVPFRGDAGAMRLARQRERLRRPFGVALPQQRQVEQPFAGIVDDVEIEPAASEAALEEARQFIVDDNAKLAHAPCRIRPDAPLHEIPDMRLVVEAGDVVVGLRLKPRLREPPLAIGFKQRQAAAMHEIVDQRADEDGFPRARQSGDAKPHRWRAAAG